MSVRTRHLPAPRPVRSAVLTISDTRTLDTDTSGQAIVALLESAGHSVASRVLVPDEPDRVVDIVRAWLANPAVDLILTTGGTGIAKRDTTYEAMRSVIEREMPGFGELFRRLSYDEIGTAAMLTRATAGIAGHAVVFVLPGSEHAVRLALSRLILPELAHIVRELDRP